MNKISIIGILALVGLLGYWAGLQNSSGNSFLDSSELNNVKSSRSDFFEHMVSQSKPAFEPNRGEFSTNRTDGETPPAPTRKQTREELLQQVDSNDPFEQMSAFLQLCQSLDGETIKAMIEAAEKKDWEGIEAMLFLNYFTYAWAKHDPIAAIEWSKTRDPFIEKDLVSAVMLSGWASVDPEAALSWARENESLRDNEQKRGNELLIGVMKGMAETDLAGATELMKELNYGLYLDKAASTLIASAWAKGEQTAIDWVESFPDGKARNSAYEALGKRLIREDIDRAVIWVDSMNESEIKTKVAEETAKAMAILSPEKAADWVARMPTGETRSASMERVASQWVEQDPIATAEWLNGFPNDQSIDGALAIFSHQIAEKQPQSALQWAQAIEGRERRARIIQYIKNK